MENINTYIDHTLLDPLATEAQITKLCEEAAIYRFKSVCVHGTYVALAKELLRDTKVLVCTVVGFPLGAATTAAKVAEAEDAVKDGAGEVDMVINQGWVKDKAYSKITQEVHFIKHAIGGAVLKVIIETANLSKEEIVAVSKAVVEGGGDFVKTSTGFASRGASLEDITIIKNTVGNNALIKASGGIRSYEDAIAFIAKGADRIGTSSGIKIVSHFGKQ
ncbi:deoxyribose-phosphate aldolase [Robertkochia sediminum]|uniref:deoxyribose-phosphate aldolase n=1 Tax=Robertkochia sediminum TaxID=2785326 RepID=UPI00193316EE|nr:deoxyribose-phosphate aldolase [Robertkochia sediminum]MBL7473616.1 deoxyribose-phosphate aldolase [Robertkochia sediminum]